MTRRARPTAALLDDRAPALAYGTMPEQDGPPLLLLHGVGARWQVFGPLMMALHGQYRQYAPDFRGHGLSDRATSYNVHDFMSDTVRFIESVIGEPVHVYGHSLGGWIALNVAAHRPDLVRSLIIADSAIQPQVIGTDAALAWLADVPLALRSLSKSLDQFDFEVMAQYHDDRMLAGYQPDELLAKTSCPTLLLQADPDHGGFMTDADASRALARLADGHHVRLAGLGHGLHVENTSAVVESVLAFHHSALPTTTARS